MAFLEGSGERGPLHPTTSLLPFPFRIILGTPNHPSSSLGSFGRINHRYYAEYNHRIFLLRLGATDPLPLERSVQATSCDTYRLLMEQAVVMMVEMAAVPSGRHQSTRGVSLKAIIPLLIAVCLSLRFQVVGGVWEQIQPFHQAHHQHCNSFKEESQQQVMTETPLQTPLAPTLAPTVSSLASQVYMPDYIDMGLLNDEERRVARELATGLEATPYEIPSRIAEVMPGLYLSNGLSK